MTDGPVGPSLQECPVCGAIGLPERIRVHDCAAFRSWKDSGDTHAVILNGSEEIADDE